MQEYLHFLAEAFEGPSSGIIRLLLRTLQVGKMGFTGPRGSWKGRGWDAEYGIMLHKNGSTVGKLKWNTA